MKKTIVIVLLFFCAVVKNVTAQNDSHQDRPYLNNYVVSSSSLSVNGGVASAHPLASAVGIYILQKGGNAIDAAIAVQFALAVVYPQAGNIGGGGFMLMHLKDGTTKALDFREKAPLAASKNMYVDARGVLKPEKSLNGHLAAGVPGTLAGIQESLKYAKFPLSVLIQPAIDLAENGYIIRRGISDEIPFADPALNTRPNPFDGKRQWKTGDTVRQIDLAKTLKRIQKSGCWEFYNGLTAKLIVSEMKRGGGMISLKDLQSYKAKWRIPHQFSYRGYKVLSMPLPSSGGIILNQLLKMVEPYPLRKYGFGSAKALGLMIEAERIAYRDRAHYLGDADYVQVPVQKLTSEAYLEEQMSSYKQGKKGSSEEADIKLQQESKETTHFSVADKYGNAVSVTTTLNMPYGNQVVVGGAGFFLNNQMNDFSIASGQANASGGIGGANNSIEPGKRMLSSMTPTIVLKDNKLSMVLGSPGGTTIPTSVFQTIVNIIDFELGAEGAVGAHKFHHEWKPDVVYMEYGFADSVKTELRAMGYKLQGSSLGRVEGLFRNGDGYWDVVADKRGTKDTAIGY